MALAGDKGKVARTSQNSSRRKIPYSATQSGSAIRGRHQNDSDSTGAQSTVDTGILPLSSIDHLASRYSPSSGKSRDVLSSLQSLLSMEKPNARPTDIPRLRVEYDIDTPRPKPSRSRSTSSLYMKSHGRCGQLEVSGERDFKEEYLHRRAEPGHGSIGLVGGLLPLSDAKDHRSIAVRAKVPANLKDRKLIANSTSVQAEINDIGLKDKHMQVSGSLLNFPKVTNNLHQYTSTSSSDYKGILSNDTDESTDITASLTNHSLRNREIRSSRALDSSPARSDISGSLDFFYNLMEADCNNPARHHSISSRAQDRPPNQSNGFARFIEKLTNRIEMSSDQIITTSPIGNAIPVPAVEADDSKDEILNIPADVSSRLSGRTDKQGFPDIQDDPLSTYNIDVTDSNDWWRDIFDQDMMLMGSKIITNGQESFHSHTSSIESEKDSTARNEILNSSTLDQEPAVRKGGTRRNSIGRRLSISSLPPLEPMLRSMVGGIASKEVNSPNSDVFATALGRLSEESESKNRAFRVTRSESSENATIGRRSSSTEHMAMSMPVEQTASRRGSKSNFTGNLASTQDDGHEDGLHDTQNQIQIHVPVVVLRRLSSTLSNVSASMQSMASRDSVTSYLEEEIYRSLYDDDTARASAGKLSNFLAMIIAEKLDIGK